MNLVEICNKLQETAQGVSYHGDSLVAARKEPVLSEDDLAIIDDWITGASAEDEFKNRMALQDIVVKLSRTIKS